MSATKDYGKLREALLTIKGECGKHGTSCCGCLFALDSTCGITGESRFNGDWRKKPQYWNIPEIQLMRQPKEM